jgi:hypothetical protein
MNDQPYDFVEAVAQSRMASEAQHNAERWCAEKGRDLATAEQAYRVGLAKKITELRADGQPTTLAADLARGDKHVAGLRYTRDVADGVYEASKQSAWRHTANRKDLQEFLDWSKRAAFLDMGPTPKDNQSVIGGRRS